MNFGPSSPCLLVDIASQVIASVIGKLLRNTEECLSFVDQCLSRRFTLLPDICGRYLHYDGLNSVRAFSYLDCIKRTRRQTQMIYRIIADESKLTRDILR